MGLALLRISGTFFCSSRTSLFSSTDCALNILSCILTSVYSCLSVDSVLQESNQALYPIEFLNTLNISGLPPHNLNLKVGLPIIMLRNLNPNEGLCNGTRLIVKKVFTRLIEATISIGIQINELFQKY